MTTQSPLTVEQRAADEHWMRLALEVAAEAPLHADIPVGAILVDEGGVELSRGHNVRERDFDPVGHAEVVALRAAGQKRKRWNLGGTTLYVTLEPCVMCAGAIVNARVARVVYGARDAKGGGMESLFTIGVDPRLNHRVELTSGVFADEAAQKLGEFFSALRR
ncbi:MAG: tRNA adenosine(34) deaminase TadA [Polyangiaceae bacterium]|nr:tRNA adenosine(34) deaminase TadA [Polyangiaceae bacterium]